MVPLACCHISVLLALIVSCCCAWTGPATTVTATHARHLVTGPGIPTRIPDFSNTVDVLWTFSPPAPEYTFLFGFAPAVDMNSTRVYVSSYHEVYALDRDTGAVGAQFSFGYPKASDIPTPVLDADTIYVVAVQYGTLYAISKNGMQLKWKEPPRFASAFACRRPHYQHVASADPRPQYRCPAVDPQSL